MNTTEQPDRQLRRLSAGATHQKPKGTRKQSGEGPETKKSFHIEGEGVRERRQRKIKARITAERLKDGPKPQGGRCCLKGTQGEY